MAKKIKSADELLIDESKKPIRKSKTSTKSSSADVEKKEIIVEEENMPIQNLKSMELRATPSENTLTDASDSLINTNNSYNTVEKELVKKAKEFVDDAVGTLISSASSRGEYFIYVNVPEDIESYVVLFLQNTYFYSFQKVDNINRIYKIYWSNITVYEKYGTPPYSSTDVIKGRYYIGESKTFSYSGGSKITLIKYYTPAVQLLNKQLFDKIVYTVSDPPIN